MAAPDSFILTGVNGDTATFTTEAGVLLVEVDHHLIGDWAVSWQETARFSQWLDRWMAGHGDGPNRPAAVLSKTELTVTDVFGHQLTFWADTRRAGGFNLGYDGGGDRDTNCWMSLGATGALCVFLQHLTGVGGARRPASS